MGKLKEKVRLSDPDSFRANSGRYSDEIVNYIVEIEENLDVIKGIMADGGFDVDMGGIVGLPAGGTTGQIVVKTVDGHSWINVQQLLYIQNLVNTMSEIISLPVGGENDNILRRTATGYEWIPLSAFGPLQTSLTNLSSQITNALNGVSDNTALINTTRTNLESAIAAVSSSLTITNTNLSTVASDLSDLEDIVNNLDLSGGGTGGELPAGGTTGDYLIKTAGGYGWASLESATVITDILNSLSAIISLPTGGTVDQVLVRTADGYTWQDLSTGDYAQLEQDIAAANLAITTLNGTVGTLSTNVGTLSTDVGALETTVGTLSTDVGTLSTDVGALETTVGTLSTDVGTIESDVNALESSVVTLSTSVGDLYVQEHLSTELSGKDAEGIFTSVTYKRPDGTTYKTSVLSGGTSPMYTVRTETRYELNGTTVKWVNVYDLVYDVNDDLVSETLRP
jgi:methyl-accepting chemotaxis protein